MRGLVKTNVVLRSAVLTLPVNIGCFLIVTVGFRRLFIIIIGRQIIPAYVETPVKQKKPVNVVHFLKSVMTKAKAKLYATTLAGQ